MKKNLLRITFFCLSLFLLCPSTIIAQVPCSLDEWTEEYFINTEISWEWLSQPGQTQHRKLLEDGKYLFKFSEDKQWSKPSNLYRWALEGNILKMNSYSIELKESMKGNIGFNSDTQNKWIVKEFKTYALVNTIKCLVEHKINNWQQKGEFEKLAAFQERVTENNRDQKIKIYQKEVVDSLKGHFRKNIWQKKKIQIGRYDTENETFLMQHPDGDFILPVPIDRAPKFKDEILQGNRDYTEMYGPWISYDSDFILSDDKFVLSSLTFYNKINGLTFKYDIGDSKKYSTTEIDYSFTEIELPELNSSTKTATQIGSNSIKVGSSAVDLNIPTNIKVDNRYAIVIGNEDYQSYQRSLNTEQNVDYAVNDAKVFKEYCLKTFGVKEENLDFITNATAGAMNQKFNKVIKLMEKIGPQAELIVYYAGHGFPDEITKEPYLVPVDVSGTDLSAAIKLEDLYRDLGNTGAKVTVFLDACFTGGGRNSGLVAARGVRVKPQDEILNGNLVVLSASSGDQSALPYHQEGHGMFTYFLLEKLQNSKGYTTLGQLADYINRNVSITSLKVNEKEQDPVVNTSEKVAGSWRNWNF
ncbi:MAG: caspase family protein [Bacteroidota bacterium]|nr:caspase family protein [Bacteroidota bacterium]